MAFQPRYVGSEGSTFMPGPPVAYGEPAGGNAGSSGGLDQLCEVIKVAGGISLEQPPSPTSFDLPIVPLGDDDNKPKRKRRRILACPICKKMRYDASVVHDGELCKGGHIIINNAAKIWQCQQVRVFSSTDIGPMSDHSARPGVPVAVPHAVHNSQWSRGVSDDRPSTTGGLPAASPVLASFLP